MVASQHLTTTPGTSQQTGGSNMQGRPSDYTDELADTICERIADGESLRAICREDGMPGKATVFRWLASNEVFQDQYARARQAQADSLFDDVLEIVDDSRNDWMERNGADDPGWALNGDHIQRTRLRVDARKWMAGKLRPKKYGEKLERASDPENPVTFPTVIKLQAEPVDGSDG